MDNYSPIPIFYLVLPEVLFLAILIRMPTFNGNHEIFILKEMHI
jgi:hypothetical protein